MRLRLILWGAMLVGAMACSAPEEDSAYDPPPVTTADAVGGGDFAAIEARGELRLLMPAAHVDKARDPQAAGQTLHDQVRYAAEFARSLDLRPLIVPIDDAEDLIPALDAGKGDVIVANLPITPAYREHLRFTVPVDRARSTLVARTDDPIEAFDELSERTLTVPFDTHLWRTARELQQQYPGLRVESLPALDSARNIELVAAGDIDLTLVDSNLLEHLLDGRDDLRAVFPVARETGIAWGLRAEAEDLQEQLNRFLAQRQLAQPERPTRTGDLADIREERTLRLATRDGSATYFLWRGQLLGFEYELAQHFANQLGVRLEVIVADEDESLLELVRSGRADLAAAFLSPIGRGDDADIAWSRSYHRGEQTVVGRADEDAPTGVHDLDGRTLHAPAGGYQERTLRLLAQNHDIDVATLPRGRNAEMTLDQVASGEIDLALLDAHLVRNASVWVDGLAKHFRLGNPVTHRWAVRADNPELLEAVDGFLAREHRGLTYNTLYAKYFRHGERAPGVALRRTDPRQGDEISPWDDLVREHARDHGFDWRLILAQIYQESSFNPQAVSWMGATGLMQIMPPTARQLGVEGDLTDPETSIEAGIRYLAWLRERFEDDLRVQDRMWFTLAAYNAGVGHVRDARRLAEQLGHDPDRWFGNVEVAMEKLGQREYFQHARHGYVRGDEPVGYVRNIRERYQAYILWTEDCWPSCTDSPHADPPGRPRSPGAILHVRQ